MRVRKKLILLHTLFTACFAGILLLFLRPATSHIVREAEMNRAALLLEVLARDPSAVKGDEAAFVGRQSAPGSGGIGAGLSQADFDAADREPGTPVYAGTENGRTLALMRLAPGSGTGFASDGVSGADYAVAHVRIEESRRALTNLYVMVAVALIAIYALVAVTLEAFVLPQHVYGPIRRMLDAERAVRAGRDALIPDGEIPSDELGEIMRSRNESTLSLQRHQRELAGALTDLEVVAADLAKKNHLLEAARRNLADADRLASLGMMSAGIAHELNTPLAVLKGLAERMSSDPSLSLPPAQAALMVRVIGRLERLGESLLDFARVRPPVVSRSPLRGLVEEAASLVRLDPGVGRVPVANLVDESVVVWVDADRMVQVLVNLLRNACEAVRSAPTRESQSREIQPRAGVSVEAEALVRDGQSWVSLTVTDDGPGIDQSLLPSLFEPFVTSRLDSRGTGLGLAVSAGIVQEHGGLIVARNRAGQPGAVFEVLLPVGEESEVLSPES